jgi:hypothetical protein
MHYGDNMRKSSQQALLMMPALSWGKAGGEKKPTQIPTPASQPGKAETRVPVAIRRWQPET